MDNLLNKYNDAKQLLDEKERKFKRWRKETGWDTKTTKQRAEAKLANGKHGANAQKKAIKETRTALLGCTQELITSSNLDDDTKEAVDQAAQTLTLFDNNKLQPNKAFRQVTGPRKQFEDKPTYQLRKSYEGMNEGVKSNSVGMKTVADYLEGVVSNASKLITNKLKPTNRNEAIFDYFQTRLEDTAAEAKERTDKYVQSYKNQNIKNSKRELDDEEEAREYLKWMVLIEHDGVGNRKLVRCHVTGNQLTLTDINLGSDGDVCKKRKRS